MSSNQPASAALSTRREFLKRSTAAATAVTTAQLVVPRGVHAAQDSTLKVGLVGCGGRGTGAARDALSADPQAKLVAMGDAFADRIEGSLKTLKRTKNIAERADVPKERQFSGFDAYQKVIELSDVVLLATPPHFRPMHLKAAVDAGKHVFAEKPVAVDGPGVRSVRETCKLARDKGLSVVSGLCWRYHNGMRATFEQIHGGAAGDIVALECNYITSQLWHRKQNARDERHGVAGSQLALLHLALRRPQRGTTHPQPGQDDLGDGRQAAGQCCG